MGSQIIELRCPGCGGVVRVDQQECEYCYRPIMISTFQSVYDMPLPEINKYASTYKKALMENPEHVALNKSVAICYMKLKLFDKAEISFQKAMEDNFDDADVYFYAAICLLNGKRPYMISRQKIDKAIEYLNAALMIEDKGVFYYLRSYLKYDHYEKKHLRIMPTYMEDYKQANVSGVSELDKKQVFEILGVERPSGF